MWNIPNTEQLAALPPLGSQAEIAPEDVVIYLHFFLGACDWYIAEYDGKDTLYGFANLGDTQLAEWGAISFQELKELTMEAPLSHNGKRVGTLPIEVDNDLTWQPMRFAHIRIN